MSWETEPCYPKKQAVLQFENKSFHSVQVSLTSLILPFFKNAALVTSEGRVDKQPLLTFLRKLTVNKLFSILTINRSFIAKT